MPTVTRHKHTAGNDDYGTLSAWFVFAALGFYPLSGSTTYILASPVFPKATITPESQHQIHLIAHDASPANIYIHHAAINGQPLTTPFIGHEQLTDRNSTTLEFWMASKPA